MTRRRFPLPFRRPHLNPDRLRRQGLVALRFARYLGRRMQADGAVRMAAGLSYTSLLSLVPLMAIGLAMLAAFPVFGKVRADILDWAFQSLVPAVGGVAQAYLEGFIRNAGRLTSAGVMGLAVTAILLLHSVESAFNAVFRVIRPRSALSRLIVYWTVLTLGPLLLGASFSLQTYLTTIRRLAQVPPGLIDVLLLPLPTLLAGLAFTGLYAAVPNRRVRLRDAALGGAVAALMLAALRWGFGSWVTSAKAYTTVYGAVATLPLFLIWMYLSWLVVLVGAEIAAALPEWRSGMASEGRAGDAGARLAHAIEVLALLHENALGGSGPGLSRRQLLAATSSLDRDMLRSLRKLHDAGLVVESTDRRWLLARDSAAITLADVAKALDLSFDLHLPAALRSGWRETVAERLEHATAVSSEALSVPLHTLFSAPTPPAD